MKKKVAAAVPYEPQLLEDLKNPKYAARYLSACIQGDRDEDFEVLFEALHNIAKARGITNVAEKMHLTRDALYKMFMKHRNPKLQTFRGMLHSMNLELAIVPRRA